MFAFVVSMSLGCKNGDEPLSNKAAITPIFQISVAMLNGSLFKISGASKKNKNLYPRKIRFKIRVNKNYLKIQLAL